MRNTQGTFSFLPDFTDEQIKAQIQYCLDNDWPIAIEHTDEPHPRNTYWEMWGLPMFDIKDAVAIMQEVTDCRSTFPDQYVRVTGYDRSLGRATTALSFIVNRPAAEPTFELQRLEFADRQVKYSIRTQRAAGG
jgi:ribulose-bisphosphate carboxylase small chain